MQEVYKQHMHGKKILVTGGAGFIGSHLISKLLKLGAQVVCLDNLATGKLSNLSGFDNEDTFTFIKGDIRDYDICLQAMQNCDMVCHQAALGSVPRSLKNPRLSNAVNIDGFLNVLEATRQTGIKRFVYAASSSTYGDSKNLPKVEEVIGDPLSPYAVTKYVNELYAKVYAQQFDIQTIGLRYFNVFGPRQDKDGAYAAVIPKFISQLIKHEKPIVNGDGSYSRDFTYIDNVVQANILALETTNSKAFNQVYNIAFGERTSLNELIVLIKKALIKYDTAIANIEVVNGKPRPGDVPHSLASIEKAKSILGYKPRYDLSQGLKKSINWYWESLKSN